jgi:hypothetical protein
MFIFNTLLKISLCIVSQNMMTSSSQNSAPSALCHIMWQDGTIRTTYTSNSPCVRACVCVCVCVCLHTFWLNNDLKNEIRCEDLATKGRRGYESYGEIKDCDISWVFAKEAIKDDFLSVPLRLNTYPHWTTWAIPKGVQCKHVSLYIVVTYCSTM